MCEPRFSVSEFTTLPLSFEEDLAAFEAGGAAGTGIAEDKLPAGRDAESRAKLRDSGLKAAICLPACFSLLAGGITSAWEIETLVTWPGGSRGRS